jgi:REP element-mobilizing transposase RayT
VVGYVVMPEHVHLLISEPERTTLRIAIQMLKQRVSQKLRGKSPTPFWQLRITISRYGASASGSRSYAICIGIRSREV